MQWKVPSKSDAFSINIFILLSASDTLAAKLEHEFCNDNDCPIIVIVLLVLHYISSNSNSSRSSRRRRRSSGGSRSSSRRSRSHSCRV